MNNAIRYSHVNDAIRRSHGSDAICRLPAALMLSKRQLTGISRIIKWTNRAIPPK